MARELKYSSHFTDLDALQRELGAPESEGGVHVDDSAEDADGDEYGDYEDSDADDWSATSR